MSAFAEYLASIKKELDCGVATEHTYRPALKTLLEAYGQGIAATNEPKRISCGAPDFNITRNNVLLGYVETKDIGTNLEEMELAKGPHAEQFIRFRDGLPNWILTDYLEFRWFVNGKKRLTVRVADLGTKGKIKPAQDGAQKLDQLISAFLIEPALTVATAKDLATSMAHMTRIVRAQIIESFKKETAEAKHGSWLHNWLYAFREILIPDLDEAQFADMFAQTLAYGLFASRVHMPPGKEFSRELAAFNLPKTNPFLRKLFSEIAGVDMPDSIAWAVNDIVELLKHANMPEILKDFGKGKGKEDPVVHFYETFLTAYDPKTRELRGVYYTPEPVVSYIVRSIDYLLKTRFNRWKGLADENTFILDPATGTATFLYVVIEVIHQNFTKQTGAWDNYVAEHLLNRIFGFELLMAPYAVAHLKLGMQLEQTGYKFGTDQRLGIYLTNTLEQAGKKSEQLFASWVAEEANEASKIKADLPIMVVLGNPPYSGISANRGDWITELIEDYRHINGEPLREKKVWVKNDYVKFIRFGQWRIQKTGFGVLAFITDHSYLDSPTFRGMRNNLLKTFDESFILNLHGNTKRREKAPDGSKDENVFDITQGVAIALFVKHAKGHPHEVYYCDLWGPREAKYKALSETDASNTIWNKLSPSSPFFEFGAADPKTKAEYISGWRLPDVFGLGSNGVQTSRDSLVVDFDKISLIERIMYFVDPIHSDADVRDHFFGAKSVGSYPPGDTREWRLSEARVALRNRKDWRGAIIPYVYRPFDERFLLYLEEMVDWPRQEIMRNLQHPNIAFCVGRAGLVAQGNWGLLYCTNELCDHNIFYRGSSLNFPLYLYPEAKTAQAKLASDTDRRPNLSLAFLKALAEKLRLPQEEPHGLPEGITPEDIFNYAYAVFHSRTYRTRYAEFLKIDFPRLPLTSNLKLFRSLANKGAELVALQLLESPKVHDFITGFPEKGDNVVEKVQYTDKDNRVWINKTQHFGGVPKAVWDFYIGGYQVCHKWLKDRKGRKISYDDIQHYQKIVVAINETIRLMTEIDKVIDAYGGWPKAFQ